MRFIAESDDSGHWTCFREGKPEVSCGGQSAQMAFERCCAAYQLQPVGFHQLRMNGRVIFALSKPCDDCGGTGRYVGLMLEEDCRSCQGSGVC